MEIRKLDEVIKANRLLTKENKSLLSYIGNIEIYEWIEFFELEKEFSSCTEGEKE